MRSKLLTLVVLSTLSVSCAPQPSPLSIQRIYPLGPACDVTTFATSGSFSANGMLDVAPGNPQFFVGVHIGGGIAYTQQPVLIDQVELERENRNRPLVRQSVVTYRFGAGTRLTAAPYVTEFASAPDQAGDIFAALQLLSPDLGQALFDALPPSDSLEDAIDLFAEIEFTGVMSGTGDPFTTGKATYPIKVFRSTGAVCTVPLSDVCEYLGQSTSQLFKPGLYTCS